MGKQTLIKRKQNASKKVGGGGVIFRIRLRCNQALITANGDICSVIPKKKLSNKAISGQHGGRFASFPFLPIAFRIFCEVVGLFR